MIDDEAANRSRGPRFEDGLEVRRNVMGDEYVDKAFANATDTDIVTLRAASIMLATIPIICVYPFLQKYFVKGVLIGSLK